VLEEFGQKDPFTRCVVGVETRKTLNASESLFPFFSGSQSGCQFSQPAPDLDTGRAGECLFEGERLPEKALGLVELHKLTFDSGQILQPLRFQFWSQVAPIDVHQGPVAKLFSHAQIAGLLGCEHSSL
jgi:hypothetical protein